MAEFVVGQWVECVDNESAAAILDIGVFYQIKDVNRTLSLKGIPSSWAVCRFRPVEWQVGRTYKTTLEGVMATIVSLKDRRSDCYYGILSDRRGEWAWVKTTGRVFQYENSETVPHLTPYLADVSPSVETTEPSKADPINPPHYQQHPSGVECIQVTEHFVFNVGNAIKYLWRAGLKGDAVEDLRKAAWYVEREVQRQEKMKGGAE